MDHKITLEDLEQKTLTFCIAQASEKGESKDLRIIMSGGKIEWVARHFKNGKLVKASTPIQYLTTAIKAYNSF